MQSLASTRLVEVDEQFLSLEYDVMEAQIQDKLFLHFNIEKEDF